MELVLERWKLVYYTKVRLCTTKLSIYHIKLGYLEGQSIDYIVDKAGQNPNLSP